MRLDGFKLLVHGAMGFAKGIVFGFMVGMELTDCLELRRVRCWFWGAWEERH
jgi:hypothetical protein